MIKLTFNKPATSSFPKGKASGVRVRLSEDGKVEFKPSSDADSNARIEQQKRGGFIAFISGALADQIAESLPEGYYTLLEPHYGWFGAKPVSGTPIRTAPLLKVKAAADEAEEKTPQRTRRVQSTTRRVASRPRGRAAARRLEPKGAGVSTAVRQELAQAFADVAKMLGSARPAPRRRRRKATQAEEPAAAAAATQARAPTRRQTASKAPAPAKAPTAAKAPQAAKAPAPEAPKAAQEPPAQTAPPAPEAARPSTAAPEQGTERAEPVLESV
jgi:hypothetical protein